MITTTTSSVEGKAISEYLSIVDGCSVDNYYIPDTADALKIMVSAAEKLGADAIIGIRIAASESAAHHPSKMQVLYLIGTAVKFQ